MEFDGGSYVRLEWDDVIQTEADDLTVRLRTSQVSASLVSLVSSTDHTQRLVLHLQHGQLVLTLTIRSTTQVILRHLAYSNTVLPSIRHFYSLAFN